MYNKFPKSPSGSLCPYYFMGGELHPLKYGNFHSNKEKLFQIIEEEEKFILNSSGKHNRLIWIDLYDTVIDYDVIEKLINHIKIIQEKINKICLVGCSLIIKLKIMLKINHENLLLINKIQFFSDPEKAKQWLVGK